MSAFPHKITKDEQQPKHTLAIKYKSHDGY